MDIRGLSAASLFLCRGPPDKRDSLSRDKSGSNHCACIYTSFFNSRIHIHTCLYIYTCALFSCSRLAKEKELMLRTYLSKPWAESTTTYMMRVLVYLYSRGFYRAVIRWALLLYYGSFRGYFRTILYLARF